MDEDVENGGRDEREGQSNTRTDGQKERKRERGREGGREIWATDNNADIFPRILAALPGLISLKEEEARGQRKQEGGKAGGREGEKEGEGSVKAMIRGLGAPRRMRKRRRKGGLGIAFALFPPLPIHTPTARNPSPRRQRRDMASEQVTGYECPRAR